MEDILEENKRLKERVKELECLLQRKSNSNTRAYDEIRAMIINRVSKEVDVSRLEKDWMKKDTLQRAERQIMKDLKWDLRIRTIKDFTSNDIEKAREYINNYELAEDLKKSRWENENE